MLEIYDDFTYRWCPQVSNDSNETTSFINNRYFHKLYNVATDRRDA